MVLRFFSTDGTPLFVPVSVDAESVSPLGANTCTSRGSMRAGSSFGGSKRLRLLDELLELDETPEEGVKLVHEADELLLEEEAKLAYEVNELLEEDMLVHRDGLLFEVEAKLG